MVLPILNRWYVGTLVVFELFIIQRTYANFNSRMKLKCLSCEVGFFFIPEGFRWYGLNNKVKIGFVYGVKTNILVCKMWNINVFRAILDPFLNFVRGKQNCISLPECYLDKKCIDLKRKKTIYYLVKFENNYWSEHIHQQRYEDMECSCCFIKTKYNNI